MDALDITCAARDLATRLLDESRTGRLARVDVDSIRCAVAGWLLGHNAGTGSVATPQQVEDLENLTRRKFVEGGA